MSKSLLWAAVIVASISGKGWAFRNLLETPVISYIEDGRARSMDAMEMRSATPRELDGLIKSISAAKCALPEAEREPWRGAASKAAESMSMDLIQSLRPIPKENGEAQEILVRKTVRVILWNQSVNEKITQLSGLRKNLDTACPARP